MSKNCNYLLCSPQTLAICTSTLFCEGWSTDMQCKGACPLDGSWKQNLSFYIWTSVGECKTPLFMIVWSCIVKDSLWIKPTDASNSSFIGITTLHVSGSFSAHHQEFLAVNRLWYILCSCDDRFLPEVGWNCSSILLLVANDWYYDSTCFGQPFCPSSGVLSCKSALVHFVQLWWPFPTRSRMELQFHTTPGSKRLVLRLYMFRADFLPIIRSS